MCCLIQHVMKTFYLKSILIYFNINLKFIYTNYTILFCGLLILNVVTFSVTHFFCYFCLNIRRDFSIFIGIQIRCGISSYCLICCFNFSTVCFTYLFIFKVMFNSKTWYEFSLGKVSGQCKNLVAMKRSVNISRNLLGRYVTGIII